VLRSSATLKPAARKRANPLVETTNPGTDPAAAEHVLVARDGPVLTLTFNRPQARNAMTWAMYERLYAVCEEVDADEAIRVLVLKGAGGKAFVAGTDIAQFAQFKGGEDGLRYEREAGRYLERVARVGKPVIAQIQGSAVGGGFGIAAGADVRIATPESSFGVPIARTLGNCLSMANYARFVDVLGASRLKEMMLTARLLTAEEALAAGFVHRIVAADQIDAHVRELAQRMATHAPITMYVTKESIRRIQEARTLPQGDDLVIKTYGSADFREGVSAFVEKRAPRWTGK
jgi:enoyl-CoA hydratase/carnithine racemase